MHVESRGKGRDLHVVGPFSRLAHLLDMLFELLLQLCFCVVRSVDACRCGRGGGAFGVPAQVVHGHVLTVEVGVIPHVLNSGVSEECMHLLVAVELVRQSIEEAIAIAPDVASIQAIGV